MDFQRFSHLLRPVTMKYTWYGSQQIAKVTTTTIIIFTTWERRIREELMRESRLWNWTATWDSTQTAEARRWRDFQEKRRNEHVYSQRRGENGVYNERERKRIRATERQTVKRGEGHKQMHCALVIFSPGSEITRHYTGILQMVFDGLPWNALQ